MGLHVAEIMFEKGVPSFQAISKQYKQQTGLTIEIVATIHLATGEFAKLMQDSSALLSVIQADAVAVAAIDAQYEAEIAPFISTSNFEQVAKARDLKNEAKKRLNHISIIGVMVSCSDFYPIQISIQVQTINVDMYHNQHYAVASFVKSLVDLGGKYQWADEEQALPKSWRKLKKWQDYRWYNRPRK